MRVIQRCKQKELMLQSRRARKAAHTNSRRRACEDAPRRLRRRHVRVEARRHQHQCRAQLARDEARHGGAHAIPTRHVIARRDHAHAAHRLWARVPRHQRCVCVFADARAAQYAPWACQRAPGCRVSPRTRKTRPCRRTPRRVTSRGRRGGRPGARARRAPRRRGRGATAARGARPAQRTARPSPRRAAPPP